MRPVIYDVAVSADGYICGPDADISRFPASGPIVDDYMTRRQAYATAIMGRATYEFGYRFGMPAGANPYPWMDTHVFSTTLELPGDSAVRVVRDGWPEAIDTLRAREGGPIYLCGGGAFAGWLLERGVISLLRLKRAPILLGDGVRLFGASRTAPALRVVEHRPYPDGTLFQELELG